MIHRTESGENLIRAQQELTNPIANNLFLSLPPSHLTFNSINTLLICFLLVKKYEKICKTCTLFLFLFKKYPTQRKKSVDRVWVGIVTSRVETPASLSLYPPEVSWWLHCVHNGHSDQPRPDLTLSRIGFYSSYFSKGAKRV